MVTVNTDGSLEFRVYLPHAQSVELVADFTSWGAGRIPMARAAGEPEGRTREEAASGAEREAGWWSVRANAPDGDHAFSYLIDDQWWLPDYAAHGVRRNAEGRWTSLLFVPPKPRLSERFEQRRRTARAMRKSA